MTALSTLGRRQMADFLSHSPRAHDVDEVLQLRRDEIHAKGDLEYASVGVRLALLEEASHSELGRFLLCNQGLDGAWTHQIAYRRPRERQVAAELPAFDKFLMDEAPTILATQERFDIFQRIVQASLRPAMTLASMPCGLMADLLTLDFTGLKDVHLVGIDLDQESIDQATRFSKRIPAAASASFEVSDAWRVPGAARFDVLTSNGLNIYERDPQRERTLYERFFTLLKPGGLLVTSFLTPPPTGDPQMPWDLSFVDAQALLKQRVLFTEILGVRWQHFSTAADMKAKLHAVGFGRAEIHYDRARLFPTVSA
ncbi:MAG: class I SAM-dependent methyltransferase, partial [Planctomycetota bacterium]